MDESGQGGREIESALTGLPSTRPGQFAVFYALFALGLLAVGALRYVQVHAAEPHALAAYASSFYIGLAVLAVVFTVRAQVPLGRLGFSLTVPLWRIVALGLLGLVLLQLAGWALEPLWGRVFGAGRDLGRFSEETNSPAALLKLLAFSWTFAALGEELTFRILLMRGIAYALGDGRRAWVIALILQAIVFGLVHAYQGAAGVAGTLVSGLIYGGLTLAARWSIWPAALAHGLGNTIGILELYAAA